ncbi:MAG: hypothetical protein ACFFAU_08140 [Candidatus Hodarchaeota archaeon]
MAEIAFILGNKLGELTREVSYTIETANNRYRECRYQIKVDRVYESLKYITDELTRLGVEKSILSDISSYLTYLADNYGEIKRKIEGERKNLEKDNGMIVSKIKKKIQIQRKHQELKLEEIKDLGTKLEIWKDRITIGLARLSKEE